MKILLFFNILKKFWRKSKHWQKGGIISILIFSLLTILLIPFGWSGGHPSLPWWFLPSLPGAFPAMGLVYIINKEPISTDSQIYLIAIISVLLSIIFYFIIGALIGFVLKKIKSKFKLTNKNILKGLLTIGIATFYPLLVVNGLVTIYRHPSIRDFTPIGEPLMNFDKDAHHRAIEQYKINKTIILTIIGSVSILLGLFMYFRIRNIGEGLIGGSIITLVYIYFGLEISFVFLVLLLIYWVYKKNKRIRT